MARKATNYAAFVGILLGAAMQAWVPSGAAEHSQDDSVTISGRFEPPFPFDAADLWSKLAEVSALRGKGMTPDQINTIFGVKLRQLEEHAIDFNASIFAVKAYKDWYYDLTIVMYPGRPRFAFGWGQAPHTPYARFPGPDGNICIGLNTVLATLNKQGWQLESVADPTKHLVHGKQRYPARYYGFKSGESVLDATFGTQTNCLLEMAIG